ncbi:MAG TPA: 30S ribosomal protein S7 [Gemmatimonadota bacterium]|jgi:small subunit ribosomal protein S7|nr:30S ribosomal protein S7 [Gemmatimonadota bacterium]
MSRRTSAEKRQIVGDPKYRDQTAAKFINNLMYGGKKSLAEQIFYGALENIEAKTGQPGMQVFRQALSNARPQLEVKSRRVGGATYQVPTEVRPDRQVALAMRWLIGFSRARGEKTMSERLAGELMSASKNDGATIRRKEEVLRMAEANKAFAHYRW